MVRRTAASASLKVGWGLRYQAAAVMCRRSRAGSRAASKVTIENSASRQGVVRAIAFRPLPLRLDAQMRTGFLEGDLHLPASHEPSHDPCRLPRRVGTEQRLGRE